MLDSYSFEEPQYLMAQDDTAQFLSDTTNTGIPMSRQILTRYGKTDSGGSSLTSTIKSQSRKKSQPVGRHRLQANSSKALALQRGPATRQKSSRRQGGNLPSSISSLMSSQIGGIQILQSNQVYPSASVETHPNKMSTLALPLKDRHSKPFTRNGISTSKLSIQRKGHRSTGLISSDLHSEDIRGDLTTGLVIQQSLQLQQKLQSPSKGSSADRPSQTISIDALDKNATTIAEKSLLAARIEMTKKFKKQSNQSTIELSSTLSAETGAPLETKRPGNFQATTDASSTSQMLSRSRQKRSAYQEEQLNKSKAKLQTPADTTETEQVSIQRSFQRSTALLVREALSNSKQGSHWKHEIVERKLGPLKESDSPENSSRVPLSHVLNEETKTMILTQAKQSMTKKTNYKQLENTFKKLNNLVDKQKATSQGNLLKAHGGVGSVGAIRVAALRRQARGRVQGYSDMSEGSHEEGSALPSTVVSTRSKKMQIVKRKGVPFATSSFCHSKDSEQGDTATQHQTNLVITENRSQAMGQDQNLTEESASASQEGPQLELKRVFSKQRTTKKSHLDRLKAIEDRIKTDLSDSQVKKEHYELLSTSLAKLSRQQRNAGGGRRLQPRLNTAAGNILRPCKTQLPMSSRTNVRTAQGMRQRGVMRADTSSSRSPESPHHQSDTSFESERDPWGDRAALEISVESLPQPLLSKQDPSKKEDNVVSGQKMLLLPSSSGLFNAPIQRHKTAMLLHDSSTAKKVAISYGSQEAATSEHLTDKGRQVRRHRSSLKQPSNLRIMGSVKDSKPTCESPDKQLRGGSAETVQPRVNRSYVLDMKACLRDAVKKKGKGTTTQFEKAQNLLLRKDTGIPQKGTGLLGLTNLAALKHQRRSEQLLKPAIHDTSYKLFENFKLTTNRNDPSYRNWIKGRLKRAKQETQTVDTFNEDFSGEAFVNDYFMQIDPNQSSSVQKVFEMTKTQTLLGPGYYNVNRASQERSAPSFSFERETSQLFDHKHFTDYMKENQQMALDQARRVRGSRRHAANQVGFFSKSSKEQLMSVLMGFVSDGGQIDKEDVDLFVERIKEENGIVSTRSDGADSEKGIRSGQAKKPSKTHTSGGGYSQGTKQSVRKQVQSKSPHKAMNRGGGPGGKAQSQSQMSNVPRWGALTFQEKIENDMVLNRVKDIHQAPHKTDFLRLNKTQKSLAKASPKQARSTSALNSPVSKGSVLASPKDKTETSAIKKPKGPVNEAMAARKERENDKREALVRRMAHKEDKRQNLIRLGEQQEHIQESVLELYTLNAFLHSVAETYLVRYSLQHKKDAFSRRAVLLFWVIGKFKLKAKLVKIKLADSKVKQVILRWVRRWRAKRHQKMKNEILGFLEERANVGTALLRTAQTVYCHVVHIQRVFRRFICRKQFIMCVYSMSWIVAERRYLAQLKKSEQADKEKIQRMSFNELGKLQQTVVPLKVRLFYVNQYYDMARQAYKKQYSEYRQKVAIYQKRVQQSQKKRLLQDHHHHQSSGRNSHRPSSTFTLVDQIEEFTKRNLAQKVLAEEEPMFLTVIIKTDLAQMIVDALRFRVKWPEIEKGAFFHSPALRKISKLWFERIGLRYINSEMEEMNHHVVQVKVRKAEKTQGRVRRNAITPGDNFPSQQLDKYIRTHKLDSSHSSNE